ncbi:MAG: hypothetical protein COY66_03515 [Candidatus Kerfeldbacteria bacterium CG_4_10_14_0_8_um_filter_42_10]|uniref:Transposase IS200-like domain-containing protein n=1 Tax=Candidatus Kerfeldbacteria bacterium CG_4_10_14_0_8_um_filter_42_10 TaxID=2014248 RepID=A0A2M7RJX7_9BACT|nr:MAG: hypothetical protein COY66_03515 [Candidatus Kerfeldbacteria bacterium CG_4_10_14_0_8_um_filter_42_10]
MGVFTPLFLLAMILHRNSQKRIYLNNAIYFITFKTKDNYPYFKEQIFCDLFVEELKLCMKIKQFTLYAFNVLCEHIHLMLQPTGKYNYSQIVQFIKRHTSRNINILTLPEGEFGQIRLHDNTMDKCVKEYRKIFIDKYRINQFTIPTFQWQHSFYDHIIRNEMDFQRHWQYISYNHLKHGLPENWKYTSLNFEYNKALFNHYHNLL